MKAPADKVAFCVAPPSTVYVTAALLFGAPVKVIKALPFAAPAHGDSATKPLAVAAVGHGGAAFKGTENLLVVVCVKISAGEEVVV